MDVALAERPDDVEALRAMILAARQREDAAALEVERLGARAASLSAQRQHLEAEVERLTAENARWEHIVAQLRRLAFGKSSERIDPAQLQLGLEDLEALATPARRSRRRAIRSLRRIARASAGRS